MKRLRLGESLIEKGLIQEDQLKQALDAQLIYGGTLGTCLIENGWLSESELGQALVEVFRVGYASNERFMAIPNYVVNKIPAKLVEKHLVVPFDMDDKVLLVAMSDPGNLAALDELRFASGCVIDPWVSPEARIFQAMERYYKLPRRTRYITICQTLDRFAEANGGEMQIERLGGEIVFDMQAESAGHQSVGSSASTVRAATATLEQEITHDAISDRLCHAEDRFEIADAVLDSAAADMPRVALFMVKNGEATLWRWRGLDIDSEVALEAVFPITDEPLFGLLLGNLSFRGPVPEDDRYRSFFERLDLPAPREILLLPVYVDDRLIAVFYGEAGPTGCIEGDTDQYATLMRKLGLALNMLYYKLKIRST